MSWLADAEAFLSGTAAVLSPVGSMIYQGVEYQVGDGQVGEQSMHLKSLLTGIQTGQNNDPYGWTSSVE